MKKIVKVFKSHVEAEDSNREFYGTLSPSQRLEILLTLIARYNSAKYDEAGAGFKRVYRVTKRA